MITDFKLHITKFSFPVSGVSNYFAMTGINVIDYMTVDKFLSGSFPIFNDSLTEDEGILRFKAADIDLDISLLLNNTSNLGKSIEEFFKLDEKVILRVYIEVNGWQRAMLFIDLESIEFNYNRGDFGSIVRITMLSAEKEWADYAKSKVFGDIISDQLILNAGGVDLILNNFLNNLNIYYLNQLDINSKVNQQYGFIPKMGHLKMVFNDTDCWTIFSDWVKGFGFMFKIFPYGSASISQWEKPYMKLFWREEGSTIAVVKTIKHLEGLSGNTKPLLLIKYAQQQIPNIGIDTRGLSNWFEGFVRYTSYYSGFIRKWRQDIPYYSRKKIYRVLEPVPNHNNWSDLPEDEMNIIDLEMISWNTNEFARWYTYWAIQELSNTQHTHATAPRMFVKNSNYWKYYYESFYRYLDEGFPLIVNILLPYRYDYFVTALKKTKNLEIEYPALFDVTSYSKITFENTDYWIEKVSNVDTINETAEIRTVKV